MEGRISRGTFAKYLEIDRAEIDDYLAAAGFGEGNYAYITDRDSTSTIHFSLQSVTEFKSLVDLQDTGYNPLISLYFSWKPDPKQV